MLDSFRSRYPQGRLISELVTIHNGKYIVRTLVQMNGETLASGLAAADTVELAEDQARMRSLIILGINSPSSISQTTSQSSVTTHPFASNPSPPTSIREPATKTPVTPPAETSKFVKERLPVETKPIFPEPPAIASSVSATPTPIPSQVDKQPIFPEASSPITSPVSATPIGLPSPSEDLHSNRWLESTSNYSNIEQQTLPTTEALTASASEIGSDRVSTAAATSHNTKAHVDLPSSTPEVTASAPPVDLSDYNAQIGILLQRLNWSDQQERDYLEHAYGKTTRGLLDDEKLLDFLQYLEVYAQVSDEIKTQGWKSKQEKDYLEHNQGGRSLELLTIEELQEFLEYLQAFGQTSQKIRDLAWTADQGKNYLNETYGVKGRTRLNLEQLQDFLQYLQSL